jgi:hypothetical protein
MATLQRISGTGRARIGTRWLDAQFEYEYFSPDDNELPIDETWTVRIKEADAEALALLHGERVQLILSDREPVDVRLRTSRFKDGYAWLEFQPVMPV